MKNSEEFINACNELGISSSLLAKEKGIQIINSIIPTFKVEKTTGHLSINENALSLPLEPHEFEYSKLLSEEPAYLFFDQENHNKGEVVKIEDAKKICEVLENCFGMEYFVSNEDFSYLIAVNWYTIQVIGTAKDRLNSLV